jgi:hypothetical protein
MGNKSDTLAMPRSKRINFDLVAWGGVIITKVYLGMKPEVRAAFWRRPSNAEL